MGHYDSSYDYEVNQNIENTRNEIIYELNKINNIDDIYLIQKLINKRNKLKVFFEILNKGL